MGVRDALLHNITGSNFEALQSGDTARIKGDFSVKNTSDVEIFGVDVSAATVNVAGNITSTMNVSGSGTSTGSFGRFVASTYQGDGKAIRQTLVRSSGLITSSAQIAADISGAFDKGFFFGFEASSSISGGMGITGSFGRLQGEEFFGSGVGLQSTLPRNPGLITGSAQLASRISGSFNKGFEFTGTIAASQITVGGTWSVGGAMNNPAQFAAAAGTKNAVVSAGGKNIIYDDASCEAPTEEYNGLTWSNIAAMGDGKGRNRMAGTGTSEAAIFIGGYCDPHYRNRCESEKWNGSSWSEEADLILGRYGGHATGTSEAALFFAGGTPSPSHPKDETEAYDGTSWSECNDLVGSGALFAGSFGASQNSAILAGGLPSSEAHNPYSSPNNTEEWNGTNWSEIADAGQLFYGQAGAGTVNDGQIFAGVFNFPSAPTNDYGVAAPAPSNTQTWDGTAWAQGSRLNVGRRYVGGDGGAQTAIAFGGSSASPSPMGSVNSSTCTEEYTGVTVGTGSFGRVVATTFHGDGQNLQSTLPRSPGIVTSSAQLASDISGSFNKGFTFTTTSSLGSSSGSLISGQEANLTVDRLKANHLTGNGSNLVSLLAPGLVTGSAQLGVSGSFNKGFGHQNQISGSAISTGSFGRVDSDNFVGDGSLLTNIPIPTGLVTGSGQLAAQISGAFTSGFEFTGQITDLRPNIGSWKVGPSLIRSAGTSGTTGAFNAIFILGGGSVQIDTVSSKADTQNWDGDVFTEGVAMINKRSGTTAFGTANATATTGTHYGPGPSAPAGQRLTEEFDGTSWTDTATNIIDSGLGNSVGTQNAGVAWGSSSPGNYGSSAGGASAGGAGISKRGYTTEEYGGANWSAGCNLNDIRGFGDGAAGTQTAAFAFSGETEQYNGTTWSETTEMNNPRSNMGGGTQNDAFGAGSTGTTCYCTEHWDGTAWSTLQGLDVISHKACNTTGGAMGDGLAGSLAIGARNNTPGPSNATSQGMKTSIWDGTSNLVNSGSFGRIENATYFGDGSNIKSTLASRTSAVLSGSKNIATQISGAFTSGFESSGNIIGCSPSVWSAGTDMITARCQASSWGVQNSALAVGAAAADNDQKTEEYNGTNWSNGGDTSVAHTRGYAFGSSQNSGVVAGGTAGPGSTNGISELYNGTSWSTISSPAADLGAPMFGGAALGIQNAGLAFGNLGSGGGNVGAYDSKYLNIEQFDGEAWSELAVYQMDYARTNHMGAGTQNSAILIGSAFTARCSELWPGTSFQTVAGATAANRGGAAGGGGHSQNDAYIAGGNQNASPYAATTCTEEWDGTSWSNRNALINARSQGSLGDLGTTSAGVVFGGCASPAVRAYTEEYTSTNVTTGSFGLLKPRAGGIDTKAFQVTSASLFKLPVFSDRELNYQAYEAQYSTGSLSGSVDRVADVIVGQNLGEMWFDSDKNAIGYTYSSSSLISQSLDLGTFNNTSASGHYFTSSIGLFSQSFYNHAVVTCYLTGSQI